MTPIEDDNSWKQQKQQQPASSSTSSSSSSKNKLSKAIICLIVMFMVLGCLELLVQVSTLKYPIQWKTTMTTTAIAAIDDDDNNNKDNNNNNTTLFIKGETNRSNTIDNNTENNINTTTIIIDSEIDYQAFWKKAEAMAAAAQIVAATHHTNSTTKQYSCPKVYVYDNLPRNLIDKNGQSGFGNIQSMKGKDNKKYKGYIYSTNQYTFPSILERRLQDYRCRTNNPTVADLFFAPILSAPKKFDQWGAICPTISADMVRDSLSFLNTSNGCRHFLAIGKGHYVGRRCIGWWVNPIPELQPIQRLAYSEFGFTKDPIGGHQYIFNDTDYVYPNLHSVPHSTSLHFHSSIPNIKMPQFQNMDKRKTLMSFIGKDSHGDVEVRRQIHEQCDKYNNKTICDYQPKFNNELVTAKAESIFCLEPGGDNPWRKSIADSIVFGCIPVLFSNLTDDWTPWFWDDWKAHGRVLIDRNDFVTGRVDLHKLLSSITSNLLQLMQTTLIEKARLFQYSIDDDPNDGISLVLDRLHQEAMKMEKNGVCDGGGD